MDIDSPGMLRHEASGICLLADVIAKSALKCGAQVTGGYFSDPGFKDVPEPWNLAFPIAEVESDGSAVITKVKGSGGAVNLMTVKEQLLYEVHDAANYITPDVVVYFTTTQLEEIGFDRVRVTNISGKPRTPTLKVSIGCMEGFIGEDIFFYAGVVTGKVTRYEIDGLAMLNFVAEGALGGGLSRSLCLDNYGKSLSAALLGFELEIPKALRGQLGGMNF